MSCPHHSGSSDTDGQSCVLCGERVREAYEVTDRPKQLFVDRVKELREGNRLTPGELLWTLSHVSYEDWGYLTSEEATSRCAIARFDTGWQVISPMDRDVPVTLSLHRTIHGSSTPRTVEECPLSGFELPAGLDSNLWTWSPKVSGFLLHEESPSAEVLDSIISTLEITEGATRIVVPWAGMEAVYEGDELLDETPSLDDEVFNASLMLLRATGEYAKSPISLTGFVEVHESATQLPELCEYSRLFSLVDELIDGGFIFLGMQCCGSCAASSLRESGEKESPTALILYFGEHASSMFLPNGQVDGQLTVLHNPDSEDFFDTSLGRFFDQVSGELGFSHFHFEDRWFA